MSDRLIKKWLNLKRIARFGDTDAAGVIHFYQLFRWSHEAWEESLQTFGINVLEIFPTSHEGAPRLASLLPIVHCSAEFYLPIYVGDCLDVELCPKKIDSSSFELKVIFQSKHKRVALVCVKHFSIDSVNRQRCSLPLPLSTWLAESEHT